MKHSILESYQRHFGQPQCYVNSPGRANIIGEHTDYNHGLVLPFAIGQSIHMYMGKNDSSCLNMAAVDLNEKASIDITNLSFRNEGWIRYFNNCLVVLDIKISIGIDVAFGGDLPQGGGVSSSSALACGFLSGINKLLGLDLSMDTIIELASQAENGIGLNGGIMDQTAIVKGQKGKALLIDFYDQSINTYALTGNNYKFHLINSGQKHNLVDTEYNNRRASCDQALRQVQVVDPQVETMRQMTHAHVDEILREETEKKRCIHVIDENERVVRAAQALVAKQFEELGGLMLKSHKSLSENYEVSTPEIDYLVSRTQKIENMMGSRIMGGGFGGCTINFSNGELNSKDIEALSRDYYENTGFELTVIEIEACDGVYVELLN